MGLRLLELRLGLLDLLLLGNNLRLDIRDVGLGDLDLRCSLIDSDAIIALVDLLARRSPALTCWLSVTGISVT
ncbi:hypothetical protein ACVWZR_000188 [Bradyrhizobium sp. i1.3.1]